MRTREALDAWMARAAELVMRTMYDAIDVAGIPADAAVVAGYVDGQWPSYFDLVIAFPKAQHVSITVFGGAADVCDCERGDLTAAGAAAWAQRRQAAGHRPCIYTSLSVWDAVRGEVARRGGFPVDYWIADWTGREHLVGGSVATQHTSLDAYDISVVADGWPVSTLATSGGPTLSRNLDAPIVAAVNRPQNDGYWLVGADGGVFNFGAAPQLPDPVVNAKLTRPVVDAFATPSGMGLTLVGADGGTFPLGDAKDWGNIPGLGVGPAA